MRFTRPSNSPRYFVPATSGPSESASTRLLRKRRRHVPRHDALREAFDDRGLADAGFADQHRIVLAAPRENRDDAFDLVVATDDRIEFAGARELGEVARKMSAASACRRSSIERRFESSSRFSISIAPPAIKPGRSERRAEKGKRAGGGVPLRAMRRTARFGRQRSSTGAVRTTRKWCSSCLPLLPATGIRFALGLLRLRQEDNRER